MLYFMGGNRSNQAATLAQATATTNTVSASRQTPVDESITGGGAERNTIPRSQAHSHVHSLQRVLPLPPPISGTSGRGRTLHRTARALLNITSPTAPALPVIAEEAERLPTSALPPSQPVVDPPARGLVAYWSDTPQAVPASIEEETRGAAGIVPEGQSRNTETGELVEPRRRSSGSSSNGSEVLTGERQSVSGSVEDELREAKLKLDDFAERYLNAQNRIQELESDNDHKASQMKRAEDAALRDKAELKRTHEEEIEEQQWTIIQLQQSLQDSQRQIKMKDEDEAESTRQLDLVLRELDATREISAAHAGRIERLGTTNADLGNALRRAQDTVAEKELIIQELQQKCLALEETKRNPERMPIKFSFGVASPFIPDSASAGFF